MPTQEDRADLSSAIMNIPCNPPGHPDGNVDQRLAYRVGHRDARHAAAELALAARSTDPEGERSALELARDALDEIAMAGMSGTGQESDEAMTDWHARRAWEFIGIAARARNAVKSALATSAATPEPSGLTASVSVPRELLREARDNCEATLAETDISAFRKEYRMELLARLDAALSASARAVAPFDLIAHIQRAKAFSEKTFGPGARSKGVVAHIRKELLEIEANPSDLTEWVDVMILAMDGAWRAGHSPESICAGIVAKQTKNEGRTWPDWRTASPDGPIEHDRSCDAFPATPTAPMEPAAAPEAEASDLEFDDYPEFHDGAMGCGLEDRGIRDRYEAMRYGWEEALERVEERITIFLDNLKFPAAKSAAPAAVALDDESDRSENWLSCKGEQRAATPTGASMEPVAFTDVERSMVGFCMSQMDGLSDSEWRAHGFRRSTFERAENKMQTILTASASPTTQEGTK